MSQHLYGRRRVLHLGLAASMGSVVAVIGNTSRAWAETGGYPYANYSGPGSDASQYLWTDENGQWYSDKYRFAYRNCTDFVAWKLDAANGWYVGVSMGHAKDWGSWAIDASRNYAVDMDPAPGAVAWWAANAHGMSSYGHVAWVKSVDGDNVTVEEYNNPGGGTWGSRSFHKSKVSGYIHFKDLDNSSGGSGTPQPTTSNYVRRMKKRSFGSAQQLWTATESAVYVDSWWPGSGGISHQRVYTAKANERVVDFDKITQLDGVTQSLYIATESTEGGNTGGVYEVWWKGSGYSAPAKLLTQSGIRRVVADLQQSGSTITHRLYVLAQDGPYEYWWRDGIGVSNGYRLWNINNGFSIIKNVGVDGKDEVFVATSSAVYSMKWPVSGGIQRKVVTQLANTVGLAVQNKGSTELLYTATQTGVHETWTNTSKPTGWFSDPAKVITVPGSETVVSIQERLYGGVQHIFLATGGNVYRYMLGNGGFGNPALLAGIYPSTVTGLDASLDPSDSNIRQVYIAHKSFVLERYWANGGATQGGEPIVSLKAGE